MAYTQGMECVMFDEYNIIAEEANKLQLYLLLFILCIAWEQANV